MPIVSETDPTARLLPETPIPTLAAYVDGGGGQGLFTALERTPDELIATIEAAGLRGRGGAGFSTGSKWRSIVETARKDDLAVSLVVNGAEGNPARTKTAHCC